MGNPVEGNRETKGGGGDTVLTKPLVDPWGGKGRRD